MTLAVKTFPQLTVDGFTAAYVVQGGTAQCFTKLLAGFAGLLGGGALVLQYSPDNGTTWLPLSGVTLAAAGGVITELPPGLPIRFSLTGSTTPTCTPHIAE